MEHKIFTLSTVLVLHLSLVDICNHGGNSASCSYITVVLQRIKVHACRSLQYSEYDSI